MEATNASMASPAAEARPHPRKLRKGETRGSRDDVTILLLLFLSIFIPPLAVLCVTSCDAQFALNVLLEILTFGIGSFIHAVWVILYYGKGGHLSWGQRQKIEQQRLTEAPETPATAGPPQVRSEAYADAPAYSASGGGYGGDSKYT